MSKRVLLATRDLVFRAKLAAVVAAAGGDVTRDEGACEVAVVEIDSTAVAERIAALRDRRIAVLAYGAHVRADLLRVARQAGAVAVPNSEVERRLAELLNG
ncbi:MAG TPA: hypothetical protein VEU55_02465 [Gemmatimonadales bacterium]|nr:hypothetical protein [Gemmatimonadales bacterium]